MKYFFIYECNYIVFLGYCDYICNTTIRIPPTVSFSVVGISQELPYSVCRDSKRDSSCHFQSIYAYYIAILLNTQWKESQEMVDSCASLITLIALLLAETKQQ